MLLVSSRPWPELINAFNGNSTIFLNKLNKLDIRVYCLDRFRKDRKVQGMSEYRTLQVEKTVEEVATSRRLHHHTADEDPGISLRS
jgi:hypothetical protein